MQDKQNSSNIGAAMGERPKKTCYSTPVLRVFGSVGKLTAGTGSHNGDGGNRKPAPNSDRIVKQNIIRIGTHPLGIGVYLFDYKPEHQGKWGYGRQFGVMADEVERFLPEAVSVDTDGYKMVNYDMLGISRTLH